MTTVDGKVKTSPRRGWIDYARGIAIIYVVYRHAMTGLHAANIDATTWIYLVQEASMPIFFVVSGVFIQSSLTKRGLSTFVQSKAELLLYPYFIWSAIQLTIQILFSSYSNFQKDAFYYTYIFTYPRNLDQFWYLYTLFTVMCLFAVINLKLIKFNKLLNIAIAIVFFHIAFFFHIEWFSFSNTLYYFLYMVFGFLMAGYILPRDNKFFSSYWPLALIPFFVLMQYIWWTTYNGVTRLDMISYGGYVLFVPLTLVGALLLFYFTDKLDKWKVLGFIKYIGSKSLYIYILHLMVAAVARLILMKTFPTLEPWLLLTLIVIAGVLIPIGIYHIMMRLKLGFMFEPPWLNSKENSESKPQ